MKTYGLVVLLVCTIFFLPGISSALVPKTLFGHSKLVLYLGKDRHEVDGQKCPVGVAFPKPTVVSCVCVNGIWAFYGASGCGPLSILAGHNYCFRVPSVPLLRITTISNPMKALGHSLILFNNRMDSVKQKVYRTVHLNSPLPPEEQVITVNSSWTITTKTGNQRFCFNSNKIIENMGTDEEYFEGVFCTFKWTFSNETIGEVVPGCNSTVSSQDTFPTECQPILKPTSEDVCNVKLPPNEANLVKFPHEDAFELSRRSTRKILPQEDNKDKNKDPPTNKRTSGHPNSNTISSSSTTSGKDKLVRKKGKVLNSNKGEDENDIQELPLWLRRDMEELKAEGNGTGILKRKRAPLKSTKNGPNIKELIGDEEMFHKFDLAWTSAPNFSKPSPILDTHPQMLMELWHYTRMRIKDDLQILNNKNKNNQDTYLNLAADSSSSSESIPYTRKSHPSEKMLAKLIRLSQSIMGKICPVQDNAEWLDLSVTIFLSLQSKLFDWNTLSMEDVDFQRIEASLMKCLDHSTSNSKGLLSNKDRKCQNDPESASWKDDIPDPLKSSGYDPIIETVWKTFVSVHSYCYKDFDQFFSDHHKYTTVITPLFGEGLRQYWLQDNNTAGIKRYDYGGLLGNIEELKNYLDKCTYAARISSKFPFHLTRPIGNYEGVTSTAIKQRRKKRSSSSGPPPLSPPPSPSGFEEWSKQRSIFSGGGYCLKKYNEPRDKLHQEECKVDKEPSSSSSSLSPQSHVNVHVTTNSKTIK